MRITTKWNTDLSRQAVAEVLDAVQGDANTRCMELHLLENGTAWNIPEGVTGAVSFRKPDGHKGLYDTLPDGSGAVTAAGNTVTAILAPQVLTCAGDVAAAVVLLDKDLNRLATFPFTVHVAPDPAAGKPLSNDYYKYSTVAAVSDAVDAALTALETEKQAFLAEAEEVLQSFRDAAVPDNQPLTFTGAVNATYDGSQPVRVEIPSGGSGGYVLTDADRQEIAEMVADMVEVPEDKTKLPLSGGTMGGPINMALNKITGLGAPTADSDAATMAYANAVGLIYRGALTSRSELDQAKTQGLYTYTDAEFYYTGALIVLDFGGLLVQIHFYIGEEYDHARFRLTYDNHWGGWYSMSCNCDNETTDDEW